jgi:hypothetical protein
MASYLMMASRSTGRRTFAGGRLGLSVFAQGSMPLGSDNSFHGGDSARAFTCAVIPDLAIWNVLRHTASINVAQWVRRPRTAFGKNRAYPLSTPNCVGSRR